MIGEEEIDFCQRREAEERAAAEASTHARVRDIHQMMAERYADRAWSLEESQHLASVVASPLPVV
jgi:hypothetical protein